MPRKWFVSIGIVSAIVVAVVSILAFAAAGQAAESANYLLEQESGGPIYAPATSTNYQLDNALGDPAVGQATSTNFIIDSGLTWTTSTTTTTDGGGAVCGNGAVESGESCDDGNLANGDGCSASCNPTTQCNDSVDNDGDTLVDLADNGCSSASDNDETTVSACGNGLINTGEQCDYGILNSDTGGCTTSCQLARCGDGLAQTGVEACDDGNTSSTDACTASCQLPVCGDSFIRTGVESCDDGNSTAGDGCSATCQTTTQCSDTVDNDGDGLIDLADANCTNAADTSEAAAAAVCGNNSVETGEGCDDGNTVAGDGCSATCQTTTQCSDTVDNDNDGAIDSADSDCTNTADDSEFSLALCGNGTVNAGEQCDDGNSTAGDGCSALCRLEVAGYCGDGIVNDSEQCDDGNSTTGDGCSATCQTELLVPTGCAYSNPPCGSGFVCVDNSCQPQNQLIGCAYGNPSCTDGFVCIDNVCQSINQLTGCANNNPPCESGLVCVSNVCQAAVTEEPTTVIVTTVVEVATVINDAIAEQISAVVDRVAALPVVRAVNRVVLNNPQVEKTTERLIIPTLITVNLINTATVLPALGFLPYLSFIFTEPLHFLFWRRRKYGVVYNAITKQPVDLVAVRIYNTETNRLVETRVTDTRGRYSFVGEPGQYYLKAQKEDYQFPSSTLGQNIRDGEYADLYYGAPVILTDQENTVALNIPLDPDFPAKPDRQVLREHRRRQLQRVLAFLGPVLAVMALIIVPGWFQVLMVCVHTALFIIFRRLTFAYRPKSFGSIFDQHTKTAVKQSVVRIFDTQYNKLLATQVATSRGKYNFLVGPNTYYLTVSQQQYHPYKSDTLDYRQSSENIIDLDVGLQRSNTPVALRPPAPQIPAPSAARSFSNDVPPPVSSPPVPPSSPPPVAAPPVTAVPLVHTDTPPVVSAPAVAAVPPVRVGTPPPAPPPAGPAAHPDAVAEAMANYSVPVPPSPAPSDTTIHSSPTQPPKSPTESNTQSSPPPAAENVL